MDNERILAISPHADDIELGAAGFLSKSIALGAEVKVVTTLVQSEPKATDSVREEEYREAMKVLGVADASIVLGSFGVRQKCMAVDRHWDLGTYPKQKMVTFYDAFIREFRPTTVLLPVPSFHQDHQFVHECGVAACRPTKNGDDPVRRVMAYEYPAASWGDSGGLSPTKGAYYTDISDWMPKKLEVLEAYKTQVTQNEHDLISFAGVASLARFRGLEIGVPYAEMFYVMRWVDKGA